MLRLPGDSPRVAHGWYAPLRLYGGHIRANADTVDAYVASAIISMRRVGKLGGPGRFIPLVSQDTVDTAPLHAERDRLAVEIATLGDMLRAGTASVVRLPRS